MSSYAFETITAAQALAIGAADTLSVAGPTGAATDVTVIYVADGAGAIANVDVTFGSRTVIFGAGAAALGQQPGHLTFADGSQLYIGDNAANSFTGAITLTGPGATAAGFGGAGADSLTVSGAHDLLQGNAGNDVLTAGAGDDTIYGGQDNDLINVGGGTNFGQGNKGDDTIIGTGLADTLLGGQGNDNLNGGGFLNGNLGDDNIIGTGQLFGEAGTDTLIASGSGHNTLSGGDGADLLVAGLGADSISGDAGNDTINGSGGAHLLAGGAGADQFLFGSTVTTTNATVPQIVDWSPSEDTLTFVGYSPNFGDLAQITAATYEAARAAALISVTTTHFNFVAAQVGADVYLFAGATGGLSTAVELVGHTLADFNSHNLV